MNRKQRRAAAKRGNGHAMTPDEAVELRRQAVVSEYEWLAFLLAMAEEYSESLETEDEEALERASNYVSMAESMKRDFVAPLLEALWQEELQRLEARELVKLHQARSKPQPVADESDVPEVATVEKEN